MKSAKAQRQRKIRIKQAQPARFESISRRKALRQIIACIRQNPIHPHARHLIELFNIDAEELAEAGVSYEMLRVLEKHCMSLSRLS